VSVDPAALAALCARAMPEERLTVDELAYVCFGPGDDVLGDENGAVAFRFKDHGTHRGVWIVLVVVAPERQRAGRGTALVQAALDAARDAGAGTAHLAGAVPRYLWPGVELTNTRAGMLFERFGFQRDFVGVNMAIPTTFRAPCPNDTLVERETGAGALELARRAYPHWVAELEVAIKRGTAFAARTADGHTIGFGCHSCNRATWIGPMATDPSVQHAGVGSAVLAAVCADLAAAGHATGEIAWVSNLRFYGKCGATVSRAFQSGHLALRSPPRG
jgi:GNAT superfamily N-acetyltransferase